MTRTRSAGCGLSLERWALVLFLTAICSVLSKDIMAGDIVDSQTCPGAGPWELHPVWRMQAPHLVARTRPRAPKQARRAGVDEATVFISALIDEQGRPQNLEVLRCSKPGYGFESAALEAAKRWRYEPGSLNGRPIGVYHLIRVEFDRERPET